MPIISRQHQFIFIQTPKAGGTSINSVLRQFSEEADYRLWSGKTGHALLKSVLDKEPTLGRFYKFAVVRNPYDWLVSLYIYNRQQENPTFLDATSMSFEEFVYFLIDKKKVVNSEHLKDGFIFNLLNGQTSWTHVDGLQVVDFILRFERLDKDFSIVSKRFNLSLDMLPYLNKTKVRDWFFYYDVNLIHCVYELFIQDFKFLGYQKAFPLL